MSEPPTSTSIPKRFGDIMIERERFAVFRGGEPCELTPRAFDVLLYLIDNRGRVVEKQEIFDAVWKDTFVTDNALMRAIREIRRELGDSATAPKYIETVHKRGYRFIGVVYDSDTAGNEVAAEETPATLPATAPASTATAGLANLYKLGFLVLLAAVVAAVALMIVGGNEKRVRSIAVMPLENAISGENSEHISDGISESVINSLSELHEIKVVARATAFRYRGQEFDPEKIGRELSVDAILTGRIVQVGEELTVQADLIDASDGSQIWGSRYSRKITAVYELPGAVASDVAKELGLKLTGEQTTRLAKNYTEDPEAYRLYLLGRHFWNKRSEDALNKSIEYFQQAIAKDPNYALAYAGLADSYAVMAISADLPAHEVFPKAKQAAEKALELDAGLAETHATLLRIKSQYEWDWAGAEVEYRRALELNPNYPMTHVYYMSYLVAAGRPADAVASAKRGRDLDPLSSITNAVVARALFFAGQYDEAIAAAQKTIELDENAFLARLILGRSYVQKGVFETAIAELEKAKALPGSNSEPASLLAYTFAVSGRPADARRVLEGLKQLSMTRYVQPYDIAVVYAGLGDKELAFEWLEKAVQDRNHQVTLIRSVPEFESFRADPRFAAIVRRLETGR